MASPRAAAAPPESPAASHRFARGFCFATSVLFAVATWTLLDDASWVVAYWPWPETGMSFLFLSSIAASIAAVWLVTGWGGELGTRTSIAANILVSAGGVSVFLIVLVGAGALLAAQIQVFPWRVQPQSATIFGWIFLGAEVS